MLMMTGVGFVNARIYAAPASQPAGESVAIDLINALIPNQALLLDEAGRKSLDEINRRWREARAQEEKADNPAARADAAGRREATEKGLYQLLESSGKTVDIDLRGSKIVCSPSDPTALLGDVGVLLLRLRDGDGPTRCFSTQYDLAQTRDTIPLELPRRANAWAVIRLANVPAGLSSLVLEIRRPDGTKKPLAVSVRAPQRSRLKVTVVEADTGKVVPAMIRLAWRTDGSDRRPSNALDFAPQFEGLGRLGGDRRASLPGRLAGFAWWCVPGPFDMPMPHGEWEIIVRHGLEYVPVFDTITAQPGETVERTYRLRRWADMPRLGWYSGDSHVHCRIESDRDADQIMTWARAEDVHVVSALKMSDIYRMWFHQRGFGPAFRVSRDNYVIVPGQECPRTHSDGFGHTISLNITAYVRDTEKYWLYDWVADTVHEQGGLFGFAHAYIVHPYIRRGMSLISTRPRVDFAEIMQVATMGTDFYYDWLNLGYKLTASAGTDVPWQGSIGEVRMYAYVGDAPFAADAWFNAVRAGRTFVTNGPMLEFRVDDAMPGEQINVSGDRMLRVRARAWGDPDLMVPKKLEIVRHGEVIKSIESSDVGKRELSLEFEVPAGAGCWLAAKASGSDGSLAHTTPVYVVRDSMRFWKLDAVEGLIAQRMANLDDIEQMIARCRQSKASGEADGNLTARSMAEQGDELLRRVAEAREFFQQLRQTAEKERAARSPG